MRCSTRRVSRRSIDWYDGGHWPPSTAIDEVADGVAQRRVSERRLDQSFWAYTSIQGAEASGWFEAHALSVRLMARFLERAPTAGVHSSAIGTSDVAVIRVES